MKKPRILASLHLIVLVALIFWNYYANSGVINNNTVGSVSNRLNNLFTPAGYAFAIWGLIYLGLLALALYMLISAFRGDPSRFISEAAPPLIFAHLSNALWLWLWLNENIGASVFAILFILISLIATVVRLNMERWDAPLKFIALVWWPIDLYFGWISVATIANISAYLTSINWTGGLSEVTWTLIMIVVATALALFMIFSRNMREYAAVFIWALIAIALRHSGEIETISNSAWAAVILLGIASGVHAFRNKETLPLIRKSPPEKIN